MISDVRIFDAHLDLAYLVELGRDMHVDTDDCRGSLLPAAVTLTSLRDGNVRAVLATIFTEAVETDGRIEGEFAYPIGDVDAAYRAGMRQLMLYESWAAAGAIEMMGRRGEATKRRSDAGEARDGQTQRQRERGQGARNVSDGATPTSLQARSARDGSSDQVPLRLGVLVECADPISTPDDLEMWVDRGVVAIGLAWWHGSRYAGGNGSPPKEKKGLTTIGRELVARMDQLGVVHDLTHLSQHATDDLLAATDAPIIATHSNCRALLADGLTIESQRHLDDETIREIARRGGMIGLNLVSNFLQRGIQKGQRASIDDCVAHVEHMCEVVGHRKAVGFGTDMDGGFTADHLPEGIKGPADLVKILGALGNRGWSDDELHAFAWGNWARFWGIGALGTRH